MSRAVLKGNASGTGTVTLSSPNTNDNYTLELPTDAGTVLNTASDIEAQVKTATSATGDAPIFSCRAFVNFDGTGTVAIRASGNVSSITDNGVGNYTVNFTIAMPDANYSCAASAGRLAGSAGALAELQTAYTTTSVVVTTLNTALAGADSANINVAIFR